MKAMLFAAGLGTRLRPLTNDRPKALVEVDGVPLLQMVLQRLLRAGCTEIVVNVHHFAEQIISFLQQHSFEATIHISDERNLLLDTGGGLKQAASFFDDGKPFIVHNTDVLSTIDLKKMYDWHCAQEAIATLATRHRTSSRYLLFNSQTQQLWGWTNQKTQSYRWSRRQFCVFERMAFSGIHIIEPRLFSYFSEASVFSIIDTYLAAAQTETILSYPHDDDIWLDAGKPEQIEQARQYRSLLL